MDLESSLKTLGEQALKDLYANLIGAKQFVLSQAPEVCQQIVTWQIAKGICGAIAFVAVASAFFVVLRKLKTCEMNGDEVPIMLGSGLLAVALVPSFVFACIESLNAIQAVVAPKLFLVEYIAQMLK